MRVKVLSSLSILGLVAALGLSACGGGGESVSNTASVAEPSNSSAQEALDELSANNWAKALSASPTTELIQNGKFDNGLTGWTYGQWNVSAIASEVRPGGKAMSMGWYAYQPLASTLLRAGQPYTLAVLARRAATAGDATVTLTFKDAAGTVIASYKQTLAATSYQTTTIQFIAPSYAKGSVAFDTTNGARVVVDSVSLQAPVSEPEPTPTPTPVSAPELVVNGDFANDFDAWAHGAYYNDFVASTLRPGGKTYAMGWYAYQVIAPGKLEPGKSYTLKVVTKKSSSDNTASVAVNFKDAQGKLFRSYSRNLTNLSYEETMIDFTVPVYTARATISFEVTGLIRLMIDSVSLKQRATIVQTETIASSANSYVPTGYALAFNDEFNGSALNRDKWYTRYLGGADRLNDEQQRYRDNNNHEVSNGSLKLIARQVSTTDPQGVNYESGMIRSDFTMKYGYYEARVKMPAGLGMWPAFWLISDVSELGTAPWPPEIDIFEFANNGVEDLPNMIHTGVVNRTTPPPFLYVDPAFNTQWTFYTAPYSFADDWHTIGAEWTPTTVTTYIDGKKIVTRQYEWKDEQNQPAGPAHILLNLAVGGAWAGRHGIDNSVMPQMFQIDWVRAYKKLN